MTGLKTYEKVYTMLDSVSPLRDDCGKLCGSICCSDEPFFGTDGAYIYLLPGEKEYLEANGCNLIIEKQPASEHDIPSSWGEFVYTARCPGAGKCDRKNRPIQCRTFPLEPHLKKKGRLELIYCDTELPYNCPLICEDIPLSDDFIRVTYDAWKILLEDDLIRDLVKMDSKGRRNVRVVL